MLQDFIMEREVKKKQFEVAPAVVLLVLRIEALRRHQWLCLVLMAKVFYDKGRFYARHHICIRPQFRL